MFKNDGSASLKFCWKMFQERQLLFTIYRKYTVTLLVLWQVEDLGDFEEGGDEAGEVKSWSCQTYPRGHQLPGDRPECGGRLTRGGGCSISVLDKKRLKVKINN